MTEQQMKQAREALEVGVAFAHNYSTKKADEAVRVMSQALADLDAAPSEQTRNENAAVLKNGAVVRNVYEARNAALEEAAKICDEMGEHWAAYKDTALLNGDVDLSNAASGEPRAAEFLAQRIRALKDEQPATAAAGMTFDDWYTSISIEGDMHHNMRRSWDAALCIFDQLNQDEQSKPISVDELQGRVIKRIADWCDQDEQSKTAEPADSAQAPVCHDCLISSDGKHEETCPEAAADQVNDSIKLVDFADARQFLESWGCMVYPIPQIIDMAEKSLAAHAPAQPVPESLTAEQVDRARKLTLDYAIGVFEAKGARMVNTAWVCEQLEWMKTLPLDASVITAAPQGEQQ